jgi:hypothetical protein
MAVVMRMHWSGVTPEQYEQVRREVDWEGMNAEGGRLHIAGFDDDGLNVVDVWDSPEHFQRFGEERLNPVTDRIVGSDIPPEVTFYPLHNAWSPSAELALT